MVWHLPNGSSLSATDSTSNADNGTLTNTPTATTGQIDGAALLSSASTQHIDETSTSTTDTVAVTASAWVNATSFPNAYNTVISKTYGTALGVFNQMHVKSTGKLDVYILADTSINYDGTGSHTLLTGVWYYLTYTYSSTAGLAAYVNASSDKTVAANGPIRQPQEGLFEAGNDSLVSGRLWNGKIDEVRISGIARSANWITTEYNNQSSPSSFYSLGEQITPSRVSVHGGGGVGNIKVRGKGVIFH